MANNYQWIIRRPVNINEDIRRPVGRIRLVRRTPEQIEYLCRQINNRELPADYVTSSHWFHTEPTIDNADNDNNWQRQVNFVSSSNGVPIPRVRINNSSADNNNWEQQVDYISSSNGVPIPRVRVNSSSAEDNNWELQVDYISSSHWFPPTNNSADDGDVVSSTSP